MDSHSYQPREAEDRELTSANDFPAVQTASFASVCMWRNPSQTQLLRDDNSFDQDHAFAYNEHRQSRFKPERERSFSEDFASDG